MRRIIFSTICLLLLSVASFAQDKRADFFIGYSNLQAEGVVDTDDPGSVFDDDFFDRRTGLHGFNIGATGYFNNWFGIAGDFSWHRKTEDFDFGGGDSEEVKLRTMYFMAGPRVKFNTNSQVAPFVHLLAGGANTKFDADTTIVTGGGTFTDSFEVDSTDFAMALGGGVDVKAGGVGVRFQIDYAPVFLSDRSISTLGGTGSVQTFTLEGQRQDNIRFSIGIVF